MSDWTTDAANFIERSIAALRERTVTPAHAAVRFVVFGLLAGLIALPALILICIGIFRVVVIIEQGYVWAAWFTFGGIFVLSGWFMWARRNPKVPKV